jgi:hypothetical protein
MHLTMNPSGDLPRRSTEKEGIQKKESGFTGDLMKTTALIANRTDLA